VVKFREKNEISFIAGDKKGVWQVKIPASAFNIYQKFTFGNPAYHGLHPKQAAQLLL